MRNVTPEHFTSQRGVARLLVREQLNAARCSLAQGHWLKGWETRLVGFGLSGLNFESPTPSRKLGSTSFCSESPTPPLTS